ncbi:unnamed protein product [Brassica oleracea var. botrytis]
MCGDVKEVKRFPQYFSFSLDRKIKSRHRLLREHRILLHSLRIQHQQSIPLALQLRRGSKQKMKPRHVNTCDIKRVLEETEEEAKTCIHM